MHSPNPVIRQVTFLSAGDDEVPLLVVQTEKFLDEGCNDRSKLWFSSAFDERAYQLQPFRDQLLDGVEDSFLGMPGKSTHRQR